MYGYGHLWLHPVHGLGRLLRRHDVGPADWHQGHVYVLQGLHLWYVIRVPGMIDPLPVHVYNVPHPATGPGVEFLVGIVGRDGLYSNPMDSNRIPCLNGLCLTLILGRYVCGANHYGIFLPYPGHVFRGAMVIVLMGDEDYIRRLPTL